MPCDLFITTVIRTIQHNNQTGRWLTTFKARFVPHRDDLIVVGSMKQPRRVSYHSGHLKNLKFFMVSLKWTTSNLADFIKTTPIPSPLYLVTCMVCVPQVEVWDVAGRLRHEFLGEHLGSVSSVVAMHPARPILAGANSSGRVHVFMWRQVSNEGKWQEEYSPWKIWIYPGTHSWLIYQMLVPLGGIKLFSFSIDCILF